MPVPTEEKIKRILADKPFSRFLSINSIVAMKKSWNQEVFIITDVHGRKYKLRFSDTEEKAKEIEANVRRVPHALPYFHGRDRNYLLFDFVEGKTLEGSQDLRDFYAMGKLCGEVNQFGQEGDKKELETKCWGYLQEIKKRGLISDQETIRLFKIFQQLHEKVSYDLGLEIEDVHPNNFMVDKDSRVYFVDDEGLRHAVQGIGFDKPLTQWFTKEQREAFLKGYASAKDMSFFTADFEKFIKFYNALRIIVIRFERGTDYGPHLLKLLAFK